MSIPAKEPPVSVAMFALTSLGLRKKESHHVTQIQFYIAYDLGWNVWPSSASIFRSSILECIHFFAPANFTTAFPFTSSTPPLPPLRLRPLMFSFHAVLVPSVFGFPSSSPTSSPPASSCSYIRFVSSPSSFTLRMYLDSFQGAV